MTSQTSQDSGNSLSARIRTGERIFLRQLYEQYRSEFGLWIRKNFPCDEDMAADVYQQAFTTMYYNVKEGKLTELRSSLKTYLFSIGKNLLRDHFKIDSRRKEILEVAVDIQEIDHGIMERYEQSGMKETVRNLLQRIGEPCRTVLDLYYLRGYAMEAIANRMDYKTEQIVAKRKFICLKQMRAILIKIRSLEDN